jgi:IS5 family transposase
VRQRQYLLAAATRLAEGRGVATTRTAAAPAPGRRRPDRLVAGQHRLDERAGKKGGEATGPNPTDRGKAGSKRHLVVDGQGLPLATLLTAANVNDSVVFEQVLEAIPPVHRPFGQAGRPRWRPAKVHADKAYDKPHCRRYCWEHHMGCRIARIGIESSERLGRHRWYVERTGAWYNRFRRLRVRDERRADLHQAFISLATAWILFIRLYPQY